MTVSDQSTNTTLTFWGLVKVPKAHTHRAAQFPRLTPTELLSSQGSHPQSCTVPRLTPTELLSSQVSHPQSCSVPKVHTHRAAQFPRLTPTELLSSQGSHPQSCSVPKAHTHRAAQRVPGLWIGTALSME